MNFRSKRSASFRVQPGFCQMIECRLAQLSLPNHSLTHRESNRTFTYYLQSSARAMESEAIELENDEESGTF